MNMTSAQLCVLESSSMIFEFAISISAILTIAESIILQIRRIESLSSAK